MVEIIDSLLFREKNEMGSGWFCLWSVSGCWGVAMEMAEVK
jgi:hypothetical protein